MARVKMIGSKAEVAKGGEAAWDAIAESRGRVVGPFQVPVVIWRDGKAVWISAEEALGELDGESPEPPLA